MNDFNVFNVVFYINGVENVDCRAFYKALNGQWRRLGADEYNNVEFCLNCDEVEALARDEGFNLNDLYREDELFPMLEV